jgi:hypothetical protein
MVQIPKAPVPVDSTTTFISPHNERIVYNNGARQTLIGGLYVLEVEKNGSKTYADIVVHSDLSVETIRQLVLNDNLRRVEKESPIVRETMEDSQVVEPDSVAPSSDVGEVNSAYSQTEVPPEPETVDTNGDSEDTTSDSEEVPQSVSVTDDSNDTSDEQTEVPSAESSSDSDTETNIDSQPDVGDNVGDTDPNMPEGPSLVSETQPVVQEPSFVWSPKSGAQVQRTSFILAGGSALYTGYAMYRADRFADLANAETQSQVSFEEYRSKSEQWVSNFGIASVVTGHVVSLYLGTKLLEWWAVEDTSQSSPSPTALNDLETSGIFSEGEE